MANTNFIEFNDITFTYPPVEGDLDEKGNQILPKPIFEHFSAALPTGFVSLVGQNGCGKSTLMLLASGRLQPDSGSISLLGQNPFNLSQESKNLLASVIYQNMEFETEDTVSELLAQVYSAGTYKGEAAAINPEYKPVDNEHKMPSSSHSNLLSEVIDVFELESVLNHQLTHLSKGEIQRVLLAFSILYGSSSIFMDEPLFAMENYQKEIALTYLREFVHKTGTTIYISMHEIDLSKKYSDLVLLFYPNRDMSFGTPDEVLTNDDLEKAYGIPAVMLKNKEDLTRQQLQGEADLLERTR